MTVYCLICLRRVVRPYYPNIEVRRYVLDLLFLPAIGNFQPLGQIELEVETNWLTLVICESAIVRLLPVPAVAAP